MRNACIHRQLCLRKGKHRRGQCSPKFFGASATGLTIPLRKLYLIIYMKLCFTHPVHRFFCSRSSLCNLPKRFSTSLVRALRASAGMTLMPLSSHHFFTSVYTGPWSICSWRSLTDNVRENADNTFVVYTLSQKPKKRK